MEALGQRTSNLLERIERIEVAEALLREQIEGERQLRFLVTQIVGAARNRKSVRSAGWLAAPKVHNAPAGHGRVQHDGRP
jgi:hypothetical protein